jgi:hypothetical protein
MVIGGSGRNLMVGGFGHDRGETSAAAPAALSEEGATGEVSGERSGMLLADTAAQLAEEAASRDGVLWTALTGRSTEAFADAGDAVVLDQFFGSAGIDLAEMLGGWAPS